MADGFWYHGNGKIGGEFCHIKPNDKERYGEYVKVKHGRWEVISEYPKKAECSYCGYPIEHELVCWWDYCPNCGARMDLDEVEE